MQLTFKKIEFKNFWTFGNNKQEFVFAKDGIYNITGWNKDKSGADDRFRNGVGKSTLMQILHYALYGDSIGGQISLAGLINNVNRKGMEVALDFSVDDTNYRIERGRKPEYMRFYKQGEEYIDQSLGDSRDTQQVIEKLIGISSDLFCQTVLLTCQVPVYMKQPIAVRRNIIEQVLGFTAISEKVVKLKELIKQQKQDIENSRFEYEAKIRANDTLRTTLNNQYELIVKQSEKWVSDRNMAINQLKQNISTIEQYDLDKEAEKVKKYKTYLEAVEHNRQIDLKIKEQESRCVVLESAIATNKNKIDELCKIDLNAEKEAFKFNEEVSQKEKDALAIQIENTQTKQEEAKTQNTLDGLNKELNNLMIQNDSLVKATCPYCGSPLKNAQAMLEQNDKEICEKKQQIIQLEAQIEVFKDRYKKVPTVPEKKKTLYPSIEKLMEAISMIDNLKTENDGKMEQIASIKNEISNLQGTMVAVANVAPEKSVFENLEQIATLKANLEQYKKQLVDVEQNQKNPFDEQIEQMLEQINQIEDVPVNNITELETELEHQSMLLKLLNDPKSSVRQAIIDKSISFLNQKIKDYLIKLNSEIYMEFQPDMSISMYKNGLEMGGVSSGEEGRISLALQFAFRDAWECLNGIHPNLLLIDEVLDRSGLDEAGVDAAVSCIMELKDRTRYVVSHNNTVSDKIPNTITVIKEGGFSHIEM